MPHTVMGDTQTDDQPATCYTVTSASSDVTFDRTPAAHLRTYSS